MTQAPQQEPQQPQGQQGQQQQQQQQQQQPQGAVPPWSLTAALQPALELFRAFARRWAAFCSRWYVRFAAWLGLWLFAISALLNLAVVPAVNRHVLPTAAARAEVLLQRRVEIGAVKSVSLGGALVGARPLLAVRYVALGPGPVEKSSIEVGGS